MKHDDKCEIDKGGGGVGGCLCATRAYEADPWRPEEEWR